MVPEASEHDRGAARVNWAGGAHGQRMGAWGGGRNGEPHPVPFLNPCAPERTSPNQKQRRQQQPLDTHTHTHTHMSEKTRTQTRKDKNMGEKSHWARGRRGACSRRRGIAVLCLYCSLPPAGRAETERKGTGLCAGAGTGLKVRVFPPSTPGRRAAFLPFPLPPPSPCFGDGWLRGGGAGVKGRRALWG